MLELLKYIFSDIKYFFGTIILLYVFGEAIINPVFVNIFKLFELKNKQNKEEN